MGLDMYILLYNKVEGWTEKEYNEISNLVCRLDINQYDNDPLKVNLSSLSIDKTGVENLSVHKRGECVHWFDVCQQVGYWRKSNHIHRWFVKNVQKGVDDCGYYFISMDQLSKLLDICERVLDNFIDAPKLLPNQSGFFFGNTKYNEDYLDDVKKTKNIILSLEELELDHKVLIYHSSW
jgi:hypothetical protein